MSSGTSASYYRPASSRAQYVSITVVNGGTLQLSGPDINHGYPLAEVRFSNRVGNVPRRAQLPDGASLEIADNDWVDGVLHHNRRQLLPRLLHRIENHLPAVFIALGLTVALTWAFIQYGVPSLATRVAYSLPASVDSQIGEQGLEWMDDGLLEPSKLSKKKQNRLRKMFTDMTRDLDDDHGYRLEFRRGGEEVGANAFALPSGIVIMTDEFVALAKNNNEIRSVLAHEIGHVVHRHTLRMVLQNSMTALLIASLTGDVTSTSGLAATVPTILTDAKYSRDFEREADDYARQWMDTNKVPLHHFADILERLHKSFDEEDTGEGGFLDSHPGWVERVEAFRGQR